MDIPTIGENLDYKGPKPRRDLGYRPDPIVKKIHSRYFPAMNITVHHGFEHTMKLHTLELLRYYLPSLKGEDKKRCERTIRRIENGRS